MGKIKNSNLSVCMDPLIRKINGDGQIQGLNLEDGTMLDKVCGYADDIVFLNWVLRFYPLVSLLGRDTKPPIVSSWENRKHRARAEQRKKKQKKQYKIGSISTQQNDSQTFLDFAN